MSELLKTGQPFDFLTTTPEPPLSRFVETIWFARGTVPYERERIAPTGSTVAVIVLGDPIRQVPANGDGEPLLAGKGFLLGPHDRPTINEPTGETHAVGVVTTPIGCEAVFGVGPASVRGRAINLEPAWPPAAALRTDLLAVNDPTALLDAAEATVAAGLDTDVGGLDRAEAAVAILEADPTRPIGDIADELGISHGHLDRELSRVVGLTPRTLASLLRVRRLLAALDVKQPIDWGDLAARNGWFDQAHLIRDFKRHTGVTPSTYLAAQRANYTTVNAGDAAGFVPERPAQY